MSWTRSGPWVVPATTVHLLESAGRRWRVTVAEPPGLRDGVLSVVYVLDPFGTLGSAVDVARITHLLSQGALAPLLVVGVGPDSDDLGELMTTRMRDLTPRPMEEVPSGGGDAFLDVLLDEVAPHVESEHAGNPADRTVAGWSLGGLLGAHALLSRPGAFRRHLLVSPSLWWADRSVMADLSAVAAYDGPLDVYVAAGDLEETTPERSWPVLPPGGDASDARMVSNALDLVDRLRALRRERMTVHGEILRGEHHITLWPAAFTRGLLALHGPSYRLQ